MDLRDEIERMARMTEALQALEGSGMGNRVTVLRTEYPERDHTRYSECPVL